MAKRDELQVLIAPAVEALGFELWGIDYVSQGRNTVLRIYIDSPNGINVDDCSKVSHQASGILEVEDPISSQYTLEVSSPSFAVKVNVVVPLKSASGAYNTLGKRPTSSPSGDVTSW